MLIRNVKKLALFFIILFVFIFTCIGKDFFYKGIQPDSLTGRNGLRNPERGLRGEMYVDTFPKGPNSGFSGVAFQALGPMEPYAHEQWKWMLDYMEYDGMTIIQSYIYLSDFYNRPLTEEKLSAIDNFFEEIRKYGGGTKLLLRFAYETKFRKKQNGPTKEIILTHLEQLKPILQKNADVIYVLQAGFIGAWGEWHSSVNGLEKDLAFRQKLINSLLEAIPSSRCIQIRVPGYKRLALGYKTIASYPILDNSNAFSSEAIARIGYCNDGFLATYLDGGTFTQLEGPFIEGKRDEREYTQMTKESRFVPVDGEMYWKGTSTDGEITGLKAAITLREQHYSTFSVVHGSAPFEKDETELPIDRWKKQQITPEILNENNLPVSNDYFTTKYGKIISRNAYEYIRDHLGYRLEIQKATFPEKTAGNFDISATIINRGFAGPINSRPIFFCLIGKDEKVWTLPVVQDIRTLLPALAGKKPISYTLRWQGMIPADLPNGVYRVGLWLPDEDMRLRFRPDYAIKLANDVKWFINAEGQYGINILGEDLNVSR